MKLYVLMIQDPEAELGFFIYIVKGDKKDVEKFKKFIINNYRWDEFDDWQDVYDWLGKNARKFNLKPLDFEII